MTKPKTPVMPNEPISTSPGETVNTTTKARKKVSLGPVALVAAGPGDPELLTLRSAALLREAEIVIVDAQAVEIAKAHVRSGAEVITAVDQEGVPLDQHERAKLIVTAARDGKRTVRLIAGDPWSTVLCCWRRQHCVKLKCHSRWHLGLAKSLAFRPMQDLG